MAEQKLAYYAEREIRHRRFVDDTKRRLALAPLSLGLGMIANYLLQVTYILPAIAPEGYHPRGNQISAIGLKRALTYSRLHGSSLDKIDNDALAHMTLDVGLCYYENENWAQAASFFESLRGSMYECYVGEENLAMLLGKCYYMLGLYDEAIENYELFLKVSAPDDPRRGRAERMIRAINTLGEKGLWKIEREE